MPEADKPTIIKTKIEEVPQVRRWRLTVVLEAGFVTQHELPEAGVAWLGRAPNPGPDQPEVRVVVVDDPAASRRHAQLLMGPSVRLVDLGSANGTSFRGSKLTPQVPVELLVGDSFEIGSATAILQFDNFSGELLPCRLARHVDFLQAVDGARSPFGVIRLQVVASSKVVLEVLSETVAPVDIVATNGPGEYELFSPGKDPESIRALEVSLTARLVAAGAKVRSGVATAPRDGSTGEALLAACARPASAPTPGFVVRDDAMAAIHRLVDRVAPGTINVLLLGENGTGKEVLASEIHRRSKRAAGPLVPINCAAIPENLVEGELFGVADASAYTGAKKKEGLLAAGAGGTVFLDEVGELPLAVQAKLLRVLEERKVQRLGAAKEEPLDVRFIFATNRDLEAEVARGAFRMDLFYRVNGITIVIPPLRDRLAEVEPLANTFAAELAKQDGVATPQVLPDAVAALKAWPWPGNVRELKNVIRRAVLMAGGGPIDAKVVAEAFDMGKAVAPKAPGVAVDAPASGGLREEREAAERRVVLEALEKAGGNQSQAAKALGISRRTLVNRLQSWGLTTPRKPAEPPKKPEA